MTAPMRCERCGETLEGSWSTTAFTAVGQTVQVAPDGTAAVFPRGGFVACSWNCLAVLAALRAGTDGDAAVQVVAERERQVTAEGWTPEHDDSHPQGQLALAGVCYAAEYVDMEAWGRFADTGRPTQWPWDPEWWKPKNPERDLIRAGALIAAEADRLVRARRTDDTGRF